MAQSRALELKILGNVDSLNKSLKQAQDAVNGAGMSIERSFDQVKRAVTLASVAVVGFAAAYGKQAVQAASDLNEELDKSRVVFGSGARAIEQFGDRAATALGQSKTQAIAAASNFAIFGKSAGLAGQDLVEFSTDFTVLASDLASFNNTSPEQAITAIGAALRGESEPIRQYGVLLNEATLRQAALELGIISTTKEALTPQQKVLAAQAEIFKQTSIQQGNFIDTSAGLANQQRILEAQLKTVNAEIGQKLLPYIINLSTYLNDKAIPFFRQYQEQIEKGVIIIVSLAAAVLAVNAAVKIYNATLIIATVAQAAFNAVLFANPLGLVVIGIAAVVAAFVILESRTGFLRKAWEFLTEMIGKALDAFKRVANFFGAEFETASMKHEATIKRNVQVYDESRRMSNQVTDSLRMGVLPAMRETDETSIKLSSSLDVATAANERLRDQSAQTTRQLRDQLSAAQALEAIGMGFRGSLGATGRGVSTPDEPESRRSQAELVRQFGGLIPGFNQLPTDPFYGFGQGDDIRTFRPGSGFSNNSTGSTIAPVININVNGTVLDPEGTARAIQEVLQNSAGRAGDLPLGALLGIE